MSFRLFPLLLLAAASPVSAEGLTIRTGETWVFSIARGQPAKARRVTPGAKPARNQIKVSVGAMMGTAMWVTNNSPVDYSYRAQLLLANGRADPAKACVVPANGRAAFESWPKPAVAVRLSDFKPAPAGSLCP